MVGKIRQEVSQSRIREEFSESRFTKLFLFMAKTKKSAAGHVAV